MEPTPRALLPPWGAVILSSWLPGMGQVAAGHVWAGLLWLGLHVFGIVVLLWTVMSLAVPGFLATIVTGGVLAVCWVSMLVHAYRACPRPAVRGATWPWVAAWLSYVLPGLGQLCRREWWMGSGMLVSALAIVLIPAPGDKVLGAILSAASAFQILCREPQRRMVLTTLVVGLAVPLGGAAGLHGFVLQPFRVPSPTMAPTVQAGDYVFVDKLVYRLRPPQRGEIVVFRTDDIADLPATGRASFFIKRVAGLPGERVSIRPPQLLVNGEPVDMHGVEYVSGRKWGAKFLRDEMEAVELGPAEYFVLGDNSKQSADSRFWGPLPRAAIVGRVIKVYWPLSRAGTTFDK